MMKLISMAVLVLASAPTRAANGAGPDNNDDLKREIRALRTEVQSLRLMLSELAELDRQRAQIIARALEGTPGPAASKSNNGDGAAAVPTLVADRVEAPPLREISKSPAREPRNNDRLSKGTVSGRVEVPAGEPIAYVYVENVFGQAVKGETVTIEQVKKQFSPNWAVVQKGTTVKFPNLDNIYHNVFSRSPGNSFDLGLYNANEEGKSYTFMEPGPVDLFCNIHPRMAASLLVVPNGLFVKVKPDGTFQINDVPAGKRKIVAWAPGSNVSAEWVELAAGGKGEVALRLEPKSGAHKNKEGRPYGSYK